MGALAAWVRWRFAPPISARETMQNFRAKKFSACRPTLEIHFEAAAKGGFWLANMELFRV
jgi:hypothetical protein